MILAQAGGKETSFFPRNKCCWIVSAYSECEMELSKNIFRLDEFQKNFFPLIVEMERVHFIYQSVEITAEDARILNFYRIDKPRG